MWTFPLFEALAAYGQPPVMTGTARRRPLSHHYRNPQDPHQALAIALAEVKREMRAKKLALRTDGSYYCNKAHDKGNERLNPFYIAK